MKYLYIFFTTLLATSILNAQATHSPVYDGTFDGTTYSQTFTWPAAAADWAGFANNNTSIYPLAFPNGGKVTFKATVATDADVYFRFEANPYPNQEPAQNTANVSLLASNPAGTVYEVDIPASATNTYNSAIFYVATRDVDVEISELKILKYDTDGSTVIKTDFPVYDGTFDGTTYSQTFTWPAAAADWAGFANNNTSIYPLAFPNGGKVTFKATVATDADVYFRFEANPYPNQEPAQNTANVSLLASNPAGTVYEVDIPASATNTYNSTIFYVATRDVDVEISEMVITELVTVSISKSQDFELSLYPNPAKDRVRISTTESIDRLRIYDLTGRLVKQASPHKAAFSVDVSGLSKGVYLVKLNAGDREATTKMIK